MEAKKRGKGHPRNFETPEDLYKAFEEYKDSLTEDAKKWPKVQYVGKDGERVTDYPKLPLTMEGFEVWCYSRYGTVEQYFINAGGYYESYIGICSHIKKEIRQDQITGGLLGEYNPSITQRLNGLTDKQEIKNTVEVPLFPKED